MRLSSYGPPQCPLSLTAAFPSLCRCVCIRTVGRQLRALACQHWRGVGWSVTWVGGSFCATSHCPCVCVCVRWLDRLLYDLLTFSAVVDNEVPIFVVCNKQDDASAAGATQIQSRLEDELYVVLPPLPWLLPCYSRARCGDRY